jgi:hypothetical protein
MTASGRIAGSIDPGVIIHCEMIVTGSLPPQAIKWFCLILAVSAFAVVFVSGSVWYGNDRSGEAVYQRARGIAKEDITREIHPEKFREVQTGLLFQIGVGGVLGVLGFTFFKRLGE